MIEQTNKTGQRMKRDTTMGYFNPLGFVIILFLTVLFSPYHALAQGSQLFTSNGTFNLPAGVTSVTVEAWGGGAGGNANDYGGGGGGAYSKITILNPNSSYTVTIGQGGSAGNNGTNTTFGSALTANGATGASGGAASTGSGITSYKGGNGAASGAGKGGGAAASGSGPGPDGSGINGGVGVSPGGSGGNGGNTTGGGQSGSLYGGGGGTRGSGSSTGSGGGADGAVIITWDCPSATILYSSSFFCTGVTLAPVSVNGTTGGIFSTVPLTGLSINSSGDINPSASTEGSYTVHYKIAAITGCTAVDATAAVAIHKSPISTPTGTNITCNGAGDGSITVQASGGTSPYTFSINNATYISGNTADTKVYIGLSPNTPYQIKVQDNNGCISK